MGLNKLVDTIRAKYPGSYDDMDDATLTKSVLAKYPQYSDLAAPSVGSTGAPPNNAIVRDAAKAQSNVRAAGPYTQPGAAEAGMGFGTPASQTLQDAGQAVAQGANVAAPVLTGGASLPVQMAVQGATSGAQTATEGGSGKDIAKSAAIGAVIPAAAHGVAALGAKLIKPFLISDAVKAAAEAAPSVETTATATRTSKDIARSVTPAAQQATHDVLDDVAKTAGVPASSETAASAKALDTAHGIKKQAQGIYQQLDQLSGGRYQRFVDTIDDLKDVIRNKAHIDPEAVKLAKDKLDAVQKSYASLQGEMVQQGVDPNVIRSADQKWTQMRALEDVSKKLRTAESLSGDLKPGAASLDTGLKNLRPGRLEAAVGPQNAAKLRQAVIDVGTKRAAEEAKTIAAKIEVASTKDTAAAAQKEIDTVTGRRKAAGTLALGLAGAGGVYGAYKTIRGEK